MEFLQTLLSFAPVSTSSLIIVLALVVIACASVVFLKGVNFTLNSESWGKEVIDSGVLFDKVMSILSKLCHYNLYDKFRVINSFRDFKLTLSNEGKWYFSCCDGFWKGLNESMSGSDAHVKFFNTKEEAIEHFNKHKYKIKIELNWKIISLPILIDLCLFTFTLAPLLTITVVSIVTLVMSVRWVSGKLANNVKNTDDNTKRIDGIEEKLNNE